MPYVPRERTVVDTTEKTVKNGRGLPGLGASVRARLARWLGRRHDSSGQLFIDDDVVDGLEVLPASIMEWCRRQLEEIARFEETHRQPGGTGWSDVYVRPPAPKVVEGLAIPFAPAVAALERRLPSIREVITGSLVRPTIVHRARAFGPSPLTAVVVYHGPDGRAVQSIEVTLRSTPLEASAVLGAMADLPSTSPLMIVDWHRRRMTRIGDAAGVEAFCR
jgi:hypothetical protein